MMEGRADLVSIGLKRVYEPRGPDDGMRVLVDRLWPRGLSKADAAIDMWRRDLAPSTELRRWYGHDPARWAEFRRRYREELMEKSRAVSELVQISRERRVTLLFAARNENVNNAVVLKELLEELA